LGEAVVTRFRDESERVLSEMGKEVANRLPAAQAEVVMAEFRRQLEKVLDEMEEEAGERLQNVERDAIAAEFREQLESTLVELVEKAIKPYERWIPLVFAISLFSLLATITGLLSWIPILALKVIFPLLAVLGVTEVAAEARVVRRLTLG